MNILQIQKELGTIFSLNDLAKLTGKKKTYLSKYLAEQTKKGHLHKIRNGWYSFEEIEDKFLIAKTIQYSYISLQSAIEFYGFSTQRFINLDLLTITNKKSQHISNTKIQFTKIKKQFFFGFKKQKYKNQEILVADHEKLLIDCVYNQHKISLTQSKELLQHIQISKEKIEQYLKACNSLALNKRIGYLLDTYKGITINVAINKKYDVLDLNAKNNGKQNTKWRIIVND